MPPRRRESPFLLDLRSIPPAGEGKRVQIDLAAWTIGALGDEALPWTAGALGADVILFRATAGREVVAHGRIAGELGTDCVRCTSPAKVHIDAPYDVTFVPPSSAAATDGVGGERQMHGGEAEIAVYRDEEVDLEVTMREQLILALPYAPLCREACLGLCATCGADKNEGPCACPAEAAAAAAADEDKPKNERWAAALRNVKI